MFLRATCLFLLASLFVQPCDTVELVWRPSRDADALFPFVKDGKTGFIDENGKIVIEPKFDSAHEFRDGLVETHVSDGVYADVHGEIVIPHNFFRGWDFSDGLAAALPKEQRLWGYINPRGEFAISPRFRWDPNNYVWPFSGGLAAIEVDGLFGYIDKTGEFVIQPRLLHGDAFHEDMAQVVVEGPCYYAGEGPCSDVELVPGGTKNSSVAAACKYTFVNRKGEILAGRFDRAHHFAEGLAPVKVSTMWGYIDTTGRFAIPPKFDDAMPFSDGLARVSQDGKWGYIDSTGIFVIRPQFSFADDFFEGLAAAGSRDGYAYIDHTGAQTIPERFRFAGPFFHGLANVQLAGGGKAYINRAGKHVFNYSR